MLCVHLCVYVCAYVCVSLRVKWEGEESDDPDQLLNGLFDQAKLQH